MSLDYYLVVPAEKWPTFDQLQLALVADNLAITVVRPDGVPGTAPFSMDENKDGFIFVYNLMHTNIGGWLRAFEDADFQLLEDTWEKEFSHEVVDYFRNNEIPIKQGDMLAHISFWDSDIAFGVWNFVCASFVRNFHSHFYDPQSGELLDEGALLTIGQQSIDFSEQRQILEAGPTVSPSTDPVKYNDKQSPLRGKLREFVSRLFGKKD